MLVLRRSPLALLLWAILAVGCQDVPAQDSGGALSAEQAAYDVTFYDLAVAVHPDQRRIDGTLSVTATVTDSLSALVLDLDHRLDVSRVWSSANPSRTLPFERRAGRNELWISLPETNVPGDTVRLTVAYGGTPREAPNPPWEGGVTWATTPNGAPWIATSCQTEGADLWWPVKDHPSDEPDSMDVAITVPDTLVAASNGHLNRVEKASDSTETYHWDISTPINTYAVTLNVAPYARLDTTYRSAAGEEVPVSVYVLPPDTATAQTHLPGLLDQVQFLEDALGPYPFRLDKYGVAQTPFLGMEHQTLIAYGHDFETGGLGYDAGFDALHFHELAHEWYGNCLTVRDWKDFWLHEGTATYLEALYAESNGGEDAYHEVIRHHRRQITNQSPIVRREPTGAEAAYSRDVYVKGALVLHTLRHVLGEDRLKTLLRRFVSPDPGKEPNCRHVDTEEFLRRAEAVAGRSLDAFGETYLYQAALPKLETARTGRTLSLHWARADTAFAVPVPVSVQGKRRVVDMPGGQGELTLPSDTASVRIDPENWLLRAR
jgi:aminopeptidase N